MRFKLTISFIVLGILVTPMRIFAESSTQVVVPAIPGVPKIFIPDMGRTLGIRVGLWNMLFYGTLGLAVAVAIRAVGALMTFTMLVAPGASALCLTERLSRTFKIALVQGVLASVAGVVLSYQYDLPTGSTIVALLVGFFVISFGIGQLKKG
jgi:ABC-type Mn2+/Zn2+ transport system permease subunit